MNTTIKFIIVLIVILIISAIIYSLSYIIDGEVTFSRILFSNIILAIIAFYIYKTGI